MSSALTARRKKRFICDEVDALNLSQKRDVYRRVRMAGFDAAVLKNPPSSTEVVVNIDLGLITDDAIISYIYDIICRRIEELKTPFSA